MLAKCLKKYDARVLYADSFSPIQRLVYLYSSSLHLAHMSQLSALLFLYHRMEIKFHSVVDLVDAKVRK